MAKETKKKRFIEGGLDAQERDSRKTQKAPTSMGGTASTVFDESAFKGKEFIKFSPDCNYTIKFVPYEVTETHPKVIQGKMKAGQAAYVLDYVQHAVGMNKTLVLCPKGTFGRPCPICDRFFDLRQEDPKSEEAKAIKGSRRVLYNVVVLKSTDKNVPADPEKVRLLAASQYLFESPMLDELKKGDGDEIEEYRVADLCVGADGHDKALKIMTRDTSSDGMKFLEFSFQVVSNKIELDEDALLDDAVQLHTALNVLSNDELSNLLYGGIAMSEDKEDEDLEEDIPEVKEEEEDDEEDTPAPAKNKKKTSTKMVEEEDEDEEEEEKPKRKEKAKPKNACPHNFKFGVDCGFEDECDDCECFAECRAEKKALRAAKVPKQPTEDDD